MKSVTAARGAIGDEGGEAAVAKESMKAVEGEKFQLEHDIVGKLSSLDNATATPLLTSKQYEDIMDMLEEAEDKLKRYMECAAIIEDGSESEVAVSVKKEVWTH